MLNNVPTMKLHRRKPMVLAKAKRSSNVQPPRNIRMLPTTSVISQKSSHTVFIKPAGITYFLLQIKRRVVRSCFLHFVSTTASGQGGCHALNRRPHLPVPHCG